MRTKLGEGDSPRSLAPGCRLLNLNLIFALTLTGTTKKATTTSTARTMPRKPGDFWLSCAFSVSMGMAQSQARNEKIMEDL